MIPSRFRQIPTFGRDTIRRFDTNVSAMKKLAARDWEDILQVVTEYLNFRALRTGLLVCNSRF